MLLKNLFLITEKHFLQIKKGGVFIFLKKIKSFFFNHITNTTLYYFSSINLYNKNNTPLVLNTMASIKCQ